MSVYELVPPTGEVGVVAEEKQRLDRRRHRAAFAAVADRSPQRLPAVTDAVEVGAGDGDARDTSRARLGVQAGDHGIQITEYGSGEPGWIGEGAGQHRV